MTDQENKNDPRFKWESDDHFDPNRANTPRQQLFHVFSKKQRLIERVLWIYDIASITTAFFAWYRFTDTENIKWLFLFMVALLLCVLTKVAHLIIVNRLSILREIKILRLETENNNPTPPEEVSTDFLLPKKGRILSLKEQYCWWSGLAIALVVMQLWVTPVFHPVCISKSYTKLSANQATVYIELTKRNDGPLPMTSLDNSSSLATTGPQATWADPTSPAASEPPVVNQRILDDQGTSIPYTLEAIPREPGGPKYQYLFHIPLTKPIWPGDKWTFRSLLEIKENPLFLFREGDVWNYRIGSNYGSSLTEFQTTVTLPPGAELVSVEPKPAKQYTLYKACDGVEADTIVIEYKERRRHGDQFDGLIKYRLPETSKP